ncbi:hypothetical protein [Lacticaseibacillus daqingensis]|uniref:hypothetical protein n=1 Tax=Lacticaseibacillus daqingensis TaxID=2486014 RepID=UPI0013DDA01C|nr:hypothetical protein [Lacticaseibacillus daqingensis]
MAEIFEFILLIGGFGLLFLAVALGVRFGILWALRALTDDDLAKLRRHFHADN